MKTVISVSDHLFEAAEKMAQRLGISRSELYQRAVMSFLERQDDIVREALDLVYIERTNRDLDPLVKAAGEYVLSNDTEW
jgi:metal-responsive CopG/Arc/MetJ family transcriptional regulator